MRIKIDFFSDSNTDPSAKMREAMAKAKVGNEAACEDPTVNELVATACKILGKPAGIFLISGTMSNVIAYKVHIQRPGDYLLLDETSHPLIVQSGLIAAQAHATPLPIKGTRGIFTGEQIVEFITRPSLRNIPRVGLVSIEQTTNFGGGAVWPLEYIQEISSLCKENDVFTHLDGARLFNACAHTKISPKEYASYFDSVFIDFSKGLGAPMGAILLGSEEFIEKAWYYKFQIGGGMHQAGIISAACLYALHNNINCLEEDHKKMQHLIEGLDSIDQVIIDIDLYKTNIAYFSLRTNCISTQELINVLVTNYGIRMANIKGKIRAITHRDISYEDINTTVSAIRKILSNFLH
ncbi:MULTISPECIES: threonine aldolase family protein [unclassified Wolbachia]|uniref:threonine aldolase family protein n=1 Tax=unclassified Wolbachia TaxID=2640676 RepID=UPI001CF3BD4E|nr:MULTISPECIES: threonine aldolase family protein [unclassified Wolbachia]MCA7010270.1 threonine aldolase family protein [Wolbachia endosymbiont of Tribolium confusum]